LEIKSVGKYNKEKQVPATRLADHKRVCRICHMVTNTWTHCGEKTARFAMDLKRPVFVPAKEGVIVKP
jgi:hypothetical protein